MAKYSIILVDYDPEQKLVPMRAECIDRIKKSCAGKDYELIIANEKGLQSSRNRAYGKATGDYIIWMCNDVMIDDTDILEKYTVDDAITGWKWVQFHVTGEAVPEGSCICIPRKVHDKIGLWDEEMDAGYAYEENDLYVRAQNAGFELKVVPVNLEHKESVTLHTYQSQPELEKRFETNRKIFFKKHPEYIDLGGEQYEKYRVAEIMPEDGLYQGDEGSL